MCCHLTFTKSFPQINTWTIVSLLLVCGTSFTLPWFSLIWSDLKANTVPGHGHYTVCVKDMTQCVEIQMFVCVEMVSVGELSSALWNVFSSNVRETEMLWSSALWFTEEFTSSTFIWNNNKLHSFSFSKQRVLQQKLLPLHWAAVAMWLLGCSEHRGQSKPFQQ